MSIKYFTKIEWDLKNDLFLLCQVSAAIGLTVTIQYYHFAGTEMHVDPASTDAYNTIVVGQKAWAYLPKDMYEFNEAWSCNQVHNLEDLVCSGSKFRIRTQDICLVFRTNSTFLYLFRFWPASLILFIAYCTWIIVCGQRPRNYL